LNLGTGGAV
jgi:hypothetical protein